MLCIVLGAPGSGKTLFCIMRIVRSLRTIVANLHIFLPNYEELQLEKLMAIEYDNCEMILDEAYVYLEARLSMSKVNQYLSYVLFQSRKKTVNMLLTAQIGTTIDSRYRHLANIIVLCEDCFSYFRYTIYNRDRNSKRVLHISKFNASQFYSFYDTYEVIAPIRNSFEFLPPEKKSEEIAEICKNLWNEYHKVPTLKEAQLWAITNNTPKNLLELAITQMKLKHKKK